MTLTIDQTGQLIVPKVLCDRLALAPGASVDAALDGDGIRLRAMQTSLVALPRQPLLEYLRLMPELEDEYLARHPSPPRQVEF